MSYPTLSPCGYSNCVGEAGVGGGGLGGTSASWEEVVERGFRASWGEDLPPSCCWSCDALPFFVELLVSVSVSEELRAPSSSQLSATGLDLGFLSGFSGCEGESLRLPRVFAISVGEGGLVS